MCEILLKYSGVEREGLGGTNYTHNKKKSWSSVKDHCSVVFQLNKGTKNREDA